MNEERRARAQDTTEIGERVGSSQSQFVFIASWTKESAAGDIVKSS